MVHGSINAIPSLQGSTWWDEDGVCYFDGTDGWRYYWDSQQWQPHAYIGPVEAPQAPWPSPTASDSAPGDVHQVMHTAPIAVPGSADQITNLDGTALPRGSEALGDRRAVDVTGALQYNDNTGYSHGAQLHTFVAEEPQQLEHHGPGHYSFAGTAAPANVASTYGAASFSPCPGGTFGKLTFGGRILVVEGTSISVHNISKIPADALRPAGRHATQTVSLANELSLLSSFPGPLVQSINKEKVSGRDASDFCAQCGA